MTFDEVLAQVLDLLHRQRRVSYRALKRRFDLDDDYLEDLKAELIDAQQVAVDEGGKVLVWAGSMGRAVGASREQGRTPRAYTPPHLAEKILLSKAALEGERKQVTVLFADLKGSLELLADRDPEEARQLLDPVLERMMAAVHRYEGTVNQVLGDGIMALFGAPLAHEDHTFRGCYAALRMQESVRQYSEEIQRSHGVPVQIRVGLNSGEVVVRAIDSDLHMDYTAVGQTTHLVARMEQMARPGLVLMTAATLQLAAGYIQVKPLGPIPIRGLADPMEVFELVGAGPTRTYLQVFAARGLTRFVGRQAELETLRQALERAGAGHGQVVAVMGEPGVGRTRLFYEFTRSHRTRGWLVLESRSVSWGKATAYLPLSDLLKLYFQVEERDEARKIREKVAGKLVTLDTALGPNYSRSANAAQALTYCQRAGHQAVQRSANADAISHLATALELLQTLPDTPERTQQELDLQTTMGPALIVTKGYAAPEVERVYARARELCRQLGESPQLFHVLRGLFIFYLNRGELPTAHELAEQLLILAQRQQAPPLLLEAHFAVGATLFWLGEVILARAHLEQSMALYDPHQHHSHAFLYGQDPGVACLSLTALALWVLGYPDQALERIHEALTLAYELPHPFSLARALIYAARLHQFRREPQLTQARAEAAVTLSTEQGLVYWLAEGTILRGWALAAQGQGAEGIAQMCQGLATHQATGAELVRPYLLALLAETYRQGGRADGGLHVLGEALASVHNTGEHWWEAELDRLKGELLLRQAAPAEQQAETCFQHALEIARRQQAKAWELPRGDEPESPVAAARQDPGRAGPARADLQLVHRGLGHR